MIAPELAVEPVAEGPRGSGGSGDSQRLTAIALRHLARGIARARLGWTDGPARR